jgi:hypothetical protein
MALTDGSRSTDVMPSNADCEWRIAPLNSSRVILHFNRTDMRGKVSKVFKTMRIPCVLQVVR